MRWMLTITVIVLAAPGRTLPQAPPSAILSWGKKEAVMCPPEVHEKDAKKQGISSHGHLPSFMTENNCILENHCEFRPLTRYH